MSERLNIMSSQLVYSSSLNGAAFLLFELKQVIQLKNKGLSNKDIRKTIIEENLFQFNNKGRTNRALPSLMRRADVFDEKLCELFLNSLVEVSKVINLYAIMKTDLLFFEFMNEVIREKIESNNLFIEKKDINVFFTAKAEVSEKVASWSEINLEKLKRAYMQVIYESGLLMERRGQILVPLIIEEELRRHLIKIGDKKYLQAMGDDGEI